MMKKAILIVILCLFAGVFFSFLMDDDEDEQRRGKGVDRRVTVERIMEAYNLRFNREVSQTSIIFQLVPGDSVKIECADCPVAMGDGETTKGYMGMLMQSLDGVTRLDRNSFNRWLKVKSSNGKFGLVFERDGLGEKIINISALRMWRKTRKPSSDEAGIPVSVVDVNNIYIDKLTKDNTLEQTTFYFKLKSEDQVLVDIKGVNGAVPENLICQVYKEKEEFDKTPIKTGTLIPVPKVDGGADRFAFEFAHIKEDIKGVNTYHIDIYRTPARSTGYLDIPPPPIDTVDSAQLKIDSLRADNGENDLFLAYLAKLAGGPNFQCVTPELEVTAAIHGAYVLGLQKRSKFCIDLPLSDECVASEECDGCDTLWSFWMGAGQELMNRYRFADSTRKIVSGKGLLENYARSKKYRGMQGNGIFPTQQFGEDIFFAIVDQFDKQRFLSSEKLTSADLEAWIGDGIYNFSPGRYISSYTYILKYNPARPMSLCVCNNNTVSTVPFLFKFQQYLTEPKPVDSTLLNLPVEGGEEEGSYEYEDEEAPAREAPKAKQPVFEKEDDEESSEE
jgi:hypothetical protein